MRRVTKLSIILLTLIVLYLALPVGFGIAVSHFMTQFTERENETLGKVLGMQFQFTDYKRGWFSSSALLQITSGDRTLEKIPVKITHGPSYWMDGHLSMGVGVISADHVDLESNFPYLLNFREHIGLSGEQGTFLLSPKQSTSALEDQQNVSVNGLVLTVFNNFKDNQFRFLLTGHDFHYQTPQKNMSLSIQNLNAELQANFLEKQHWDLTLGFGLHNNNVSIALPTDDSAMLLHADRIELNKLHVDTEKMAQLLKEILQAREVSQDQKSIQATNLMALLQQFLTQTIKQDTSMDVRGLALTAPMGLLKVDYDVSFPTLKTQHDYYDIATSNVSMLQLNVPRWIYQNEKANFELELTKFSYDDYSNTVFSRHSDMSFHAFDFRDLKNNTQVPTAYAVGFHYAGETNGDNKQLSQTMQWQLSKLCVSNDCYRNINAKLQLLRLNYPAFRDVASVAREFMSQKTQNMEARVAELMQVIATYQRLILPASQVIFSESTQTPHGAAVLETKVWWDNAATSPAFNNANYQLHLLFPVAYITRFINAHNDIETADAATPVTPDIKIAEFLQNAIAQGYLKKTGELYTMDLIGKGHQATINGIAIY